MISFIKFPTLVAFFLGFIFGIYILRILGNSLDTSTAPYTSFLILESLAILLVQGAVAVAAFLALKQIKVTKESFHLNSKRESIKLAIELIKEFRDKILHLSYDCDKSLTVAGFKKYEGKEKLNSFTKEEISKNKTRLDHFNSTIKLLPLKEENFPRNISDLANSLEYFATPFIEKIADEKVGFNVVGLTYCHLVEKYYFMFVISRKDNIEECTYYKNAVALYDLWSTRIDKSKLESEQKKTQASLDKIPDREIISIGTSEL